MDRFRVFKRNKVQFKESRTIYKTPSWVTLAEDEIYLDSDGVAYANDAILEYHGDQNQNGDSESKDGGLGYHGDDYSDDAASSIEEIVELINEALVQMEASTLTIPDGEREEGLVSGSDMEYIGEFEDCNTMSDVDSNDDDVLEELQHMLDDLCDTTTETLSSQSQENTRSDITIETSNLDSIYSSEQSASDLKYVENLDTQTQESNHIDSTHVDTIKSNQPADDRTQIRNDHNHLHLSESSEDSEIALNSIDNIDSNQFAQSEGIFQDESASNKEKPENVADQKKKDEL